MKGLLLVHKPLGITSHDVIDKVRRLGDIEKAGHIGTLDPTAEGLLGVLINKATKLSQFMKGFDKEYIIDLEFGQETDTLDQSGKVVQKAEPKNINKTDIKTILVDFIGKQKQVPPKYSAIKVDGKKLYEYARIDQDVDIPTRDIEIYDLELLEFTKDEKATAKLKLNCSSGTYTRSLVRDIGRQLGCFAYQTHLLRTKINKFSLEDAYSLEEIKNFSKKQLQEAILPASQAVSHLSKVVVKKEAEKFIKNGALVRLKNLTEKYDYKKGEIVQICTQEDVLLAVGEVQATLQEVNNPEEEIIKYKQVLA